MITRYFDASALVKRYVLEPYSELVSNRLQDGIPASSRLSQVEISSALALRWREGQLSREHLDRALAALGEDFESLDVVELNPLVVTLSRDLLLRHPLRAGDAIHLASGIHLMKRGLELEFLSFDQRLNMAARKEGMTVIHPAFIVLP